MLFYLQTACVIIAMIHMWFQPYQEMFLNALDGIMLLAILLEVNINTFPFLKNVTTEIVIIMVILPLLLISIAAIKNVSRVCLRKYRYLHYDPINDDDNIVENAVVRYVYAMFIVLYNNYYAIEMLIRLMHCLITKLIIFFKNHFLIMHQTMIIRA